MKLPEKLQPFLTKKKRYKVAYGGRGAAKSMSFADMLSFKVQTEGALVGCLREYQNSIADSVYALLKAEILRLGIPGYKIFKSAIDHRNKGGFRFKGLARSIDAVKSTYGFKYFWLEEGQFISQENLKTLTPTLREDDSELWISANALNSSDPFSERFINPYIKQLEKYGFYEDDLHLIVKINYNDNPWFPTALEAERQNDYQTLSRALYDHIWLGAFNDSVDDSIIFTEWFDSAIDAHKKLGFNAEGAIIASHDPSDMGTDDKGLVIRHGSVIKEAVSRSFGDVNEGCAWALDTAIDYGADLFVWDGDGIGLGLRGQIASALKGKRIIFKSFHGNNTPEFPAKAYEPVKIPNSKNKKQRTNKDLFFNLRAQKYWDLRDRFYKTYLAVEKKQYINPEELISISSNVQDIQVLRSEICRIPRKYNSHGKIQIMDKQGMKRLKILSPNVADSLMMSGITPDLAVDTDDKALNFSTFY